MTQSVNSKQYKTFFFLKVVTKIDYHEIMFVKLSLWKCNLIFISK